MLIPLATRPAHPRYCRLTPAVAAGFLLAGLIQRPDPQPARPGGGGSRPPMTNRRITLTAARWSQHAWLSSRWVLSGVASPTCSAMVQPLRLPRSDRHARTYLPAWIHGSTRRKHPRIPSISSSSRSPARPASTMRPAAVFGLVLVTQTGSRGGCAHVRPSHNKITSTGARTAPAHSTKCACPTKGGDQSATPVSALQVCFRWMLGLGFSM